jgi:hypothetical protein
MSMQQNAQYQENSLGLQRIIIQQQMERQKELMQQYKNQQETMKC